MFKNEKSLLRTGIDQRPGIRVDYRVQTTLKQLACSGWSILQITVGLL